jgi:hypothetical protein
MEIDLKPDYKYSLGELGGSALQLQLDKQLKNLSNGGEKNLEKQANELLGNLFGGKKKKKK